MNPEDTSNLTNYYLTVLNAVGFIVLIHAVITRKAFRKPAVKPAGLEPWNIALVDFGLIWTTVLLTIVFLSSASGGLYRALFDTDIPEDQLLFWGGLPMQAAMVLPLIAFYRFYHSRSKQPDIHLAPIAISGLGASALYRFLLITPLITFAYVAWTLLLESWGIEAPDQELVLQIQNQELSWALLFQALIITVLVPTCEELLFRAFTYRGLKRWMPRWSAALLSALIFALLHFNLASFIPLLLLGWWLAYSYERTGSLLVPIFIHAIFNTNTLLQLTLLKISS